MIEKANIKAMINQSATAEKFISQLVNWGVLTKKEENQNYSQAVKGKCRYFAPWFIATVAGKNRSMQRNFVIHEGTVYGKHHVWVEYEGYYIDGTLAQFLPDKDRIEIIKKEEGNEIYGDSQTYSLIEWFEREENSPF